MLTVISRNFSYFTLYACAQSLTTYLRTLFTVFVRTLCFASQEQAHFRPMNAWRDVVPCNDNVPAIITPGRVPSKGRSACLRLVPLSNNVLGTDMLLKPPRK